MENVIGKAKKSLKKRILIILSIILATVIITAGLLWNHYLNKYNVLSKYEAPTG